MKRPSRLMSPTKRQVGLRDLQDRTGDVLGHGGTNELIVLALRAALT